MNIKHLLYSILFGVAFGLTLGVLVYTAPVQAEKIATNLVELSYHHDKAPTDCDCSE